MGTCRVGFAADKDQLAHKFYLALTKLGVSCKEMDRGYSVIRYTGKASKPSEEKSFLRGAGDGVLEAPEVIEYALNRYEKYQALIAGIIGKPLPWALDDLDPATTFDDEIRKKISDVITKLKALLKKNGVKEGTEAYKEKLAVGLLYYASMPDGVLADARAPFESEVIERLEQESLEDFKSVVEESGGLRLNNDESREYTVLESLKTRRGKCTEQANILYAVMKMAGLEPVVLNIQRVEPRLRALLVDPKTQEESHTCVGLMVRGRLRQYDASLGIPDARHVEYYAMTPRQNLATHYSNEGGILVNSGALDAAFSSLAMALSLDPNWASAYSNRCALWKARKEYDKGIAQCSEALRIRKDDVVSLRNRGIMRSYRNDPNGAIADFTHALKLRPTNAELFFKRGYVRYTQRQYDAAIADLKETLRLNAAHAASYTIRGLIFIARGEYDKAIEDFSQVIFLNPDDAEAYRNRSIAWRKKGNAAKADADLREAVRLNPAYAE